MKYCTNCGNKFKKGNRFCEFCGYSRYASSVGPTFIPSEITEEKKVEQQIKKTRRSQENIIPVSTIVILLGAVCLFFLLVIFIFILDGGLSDDSILTPTIPTIQPTSLPPVVSTTTIEDEINICPEAKNDNGSCITYDKFCKEQFGNDGFADGKPIGELISVCKCKVGYIIDAKNQCSVDEEYIQDKLAEAKKLFLSSKQIESIAIYDDLLKIYPTNLTILAAKAANFLLMGEHQEQINVLDKMISINPTHVGALSGKADALAWEAWDYLKIGEYIKALNNCEIALKVYPKSMYALIHKGISLHFLGRYEEANAIYNSVLLEYPNNLEVIFYKILVLDKLNKQLDEKMNLTDRALKIDPGFIDTLDKQGSIIWSIME